MIVFCTADHHPGSPLNMLEQLDDVCVAHPDAAAGAWSAVDEMIGAAMDIDIATKCVHVSQAVEADLQATQPQDPAEDPVPPGKAGSQIVAVDFTGGTAANEYRPDRKTAADLGADIVPAAGSAAAVLLFAGAVAGARDRIVSRNYTVI